MLCATSCREEKAKFRTPLPTERIVSPLDAGCSAGTMVLAEYFLVGTHILDASIKNVLWCVEKRIIDSHSLNLPKDFKIIRPGSVGLTCEARMPVEDFMLVDRVTLYLIARALDLCVANSIQLEKGDRRIDL